MSHTSISIDDIALDPSLTFSSGQVFRWKPVDETLSAWIGVLGSSQLKVTSEEVTLLNYSSRMASDFERDVLTFLGPPAESVTDTFPKDDFFLQTALREFRGLHVLSQDPWECLVSFLCSINCNIPSIKLKLENLSRKFGAPIESSSPGFARAFEFPRPENLARATKSELLACKLGFRWRYVKFIAKKVVAGELVLDELRSREYKDAFRELVSETSPNTFGVGPKVADCVLLYSLGKTEAFPIDVWMLRYLKNFHEVEYGYIANGLTPKRYVQITDEMRRKYGQFAGYAQLFLYEKIRKDALSNHSK